MLRVVADTNVYISALNFGGVPDQILALARRGRIAMFVSKPVLEEIEGVPKRKFQWPPSRAIPSRTAPGGGQPPFPWDTTARGSLFVCACSCADSPRFVAKLR